MQETTTASPSLVKENTGAVSPSPVHLILPRAILAGLLLALFLLLTIAVACDAAWVATLDAWVQRIVFTWRSEGLTTLFAILTQGASTLVTVALALVALVVMLVLHRPRMALVYACSFGGSEAVLYLVKFLLNRQRPVGMGLIDFPFDPSYPSGHSFASLVLISYLVFILIRANDVRGVVRAFLVAFAIVWPLLIGLTRVYLGMHWPSDVFASWLLGSACLAVCTIIGDRCIQWTDAPSRRSAAGKGNER